MDRFIVDLMNIKSGLMLYLKSSMDRFIVYGNGEEKGAKKAI